jgi:hypothetical protein
MTEFITAKYPDASMPKTQDRKAMMLRVRGFLDNAKRARLREAGGEFGPWLQPGDILDRIDRRTSRMGIGPKLIVQRDSDRKQLSIREVDVGPAIPDLGAHPDVEKVHAAVWNKFDVRTGGLYLCRFIDGTNQVSKHGYVSDNWKGAAEDIFVLSGGMTELEEVAEFIVRGAKANEWQSSTVIVNRRIWTPSAGWHPYSGAQHFHVHHDCPGGHACTP